MSSPKEDELQSPLPGNGANLLSLQETLLGCISEMPGNLMWVWIKMNNYLNGLSHKTV
jgi:hypothetical protein